MKLNNQHYTRTEVLRRVGSIAQLGGARHCTLSDGRSNGVRAIDFDTGAGLRFTVLPDRGLDICSASYKGVNLVYRTPNGEVHPAFYEPGGLGWLRTFFGGLLTTCGLTYLGAPGVDRGEELGLHGRISTTPASRVADTSRWQGDDYLIEISGVIEECVLFGDKLRLTRTVSAMLGEKRLHIRDVVENYGFASSPFTVLYHINPGFPLLDAASRLVLSASETEPYDDRSAANMPDMLRFADPVPGFEEENFLHTMAADGEGRAHAAMVNPVLYGGLGLFVSFDAATLPFLNEWKMMGEGEYVVGMEPCNAPCENRAVLRERGLLPMLEPGEVREMNLEIGALEGEEEIRAFEQCVASTGGSPR